MYMGKSKMSDTNIFVTNPMFVDDEVAYDAQDDIMASTNFETRIKELEQQLHYQRELCKQLQTVTLYDTTLPQKAKRNYNKTNKRVEMEKFIAANMKNEQYMTDLVNGVALTTKNMPKAMLRSYLIFRFTDQAS